MPRAVGRLGWQMFDLKFYKLVQSTVSWAEAPPTEFANFHRMYCAKKDHPKTDAQEEPMDPALLYISMTYPPYFGFDLKRGCADKFKHKLLFLD
jgi:hypothetical protein